MEKNYWGVKMSRITVFGIMVADLVADIVEFPRVGETILGKNLKVYLGGKGFNQSVAIKRLGADVELIGYLGNDENGLKFLSVLKEEGIKHDRVKITDEYLTGVAQVQVNKSGDNKIVVIPSANHQYDIKTLIEQKDVFKETDICVFQFEMKKDVTEKAIELAYLNNNIIILNPAPVRTIPNDIINKIDYLMPNETELGVLTNIDTTTLEGVIEASRFLLKKGVKNVITTLGNKGAYIATNNIMKKVDAIKVENVLDTVGAGDSFIGAFVVKISEGASIVEAVKYANCMGALTVQVRGALESMHYRKDADELYNKYFINKQINK